MIDTVILFLQPKNFFIEDMLKFGTTKEEVLLSPVGFRKYMRNTTAQEKREGRYMPRLTLIKRGRQYSLKVEFSAPKLIYGNNLDELEEKEFSRVALVLLKKLEKINIKTTEKAIREAEISSFHPSKNIKLTSGYTAIAILKELSKINLTEKLDMDYKDFRNGGHSLQFYSNSHSFVMYDKNKDMAKPEKRSIDSGNKMNQLSLFEYLEQKNKPEILRLEVRLSHKRKMNAVLKDLGYNKNPRFKDVFKKDLCQKIVKHYWENVVINNNEFIFEPISNPERIIKGIIKNKQKIKPKEAIYLTGLYITARDMGARSFRVVIEPLTVRRNWYKIANDLKNLKISNYKYDWVKEIEDQLNKFEPMKLSTWNSV